MVERQTGKPLTQVRFHGAARDFSSRVNFQCRLSYCVRSPQCAIDFVNICAHVKDPVILVSVRLTMEILKRSSIQPLVGKHDYSAAGFPREKQPKFYIGEISTGQYSDAGKNDDNLNGQPNTSHASKNVCSTPQST